MRLNRWHNIEYSLSYSYRIIYLTSSLLTNITKNKLVDTQLARFPPDIHTDIPHHSSHHHTGPKRNTPNNYLCRSIPHLKSCSTIHHHQQGRCLSLNATEWSLTWTGRQNFEQACGHCTSIHDSWYTQRHALSHSSR